MPDTLAMSKRRNNGATYRLRRDVYDDLVATRGLKTEREQTEALGVHRATLYRILGGNAPSMNTAMQMAEALNVPMQALFERVEEVGS